MTRENVLAGIVSGVTTFITAWLGGWDAALKILFVLMVADFIFGLLAARKRKQLNSEVMFWGGIRKGAVMLVIVIAIMLDDLMGNTGPVFRTLALYFYIAREGLSVVENLGLLGVPLPSAIVKVLEQLQEKSGPSAVPKPLQVMDQPLGKPLTAVESEAVRKEGDTA